MKILKDDLLRTCFTLLTHIGETSENIAITADAMVRADMRGISTHGSYLIVKIIERYKAKMLSVPTIVTKVNNKESATVFDGGNGLGQVAAYKAINESIDNAKKYGSSLTLVRNTNNVGFLGYYTEIATQKNMIGIMGANAAAAIAPWGGKQACFGTNPLSIAIPRKNTYPLLLDMSSSVVARGKIRKAAREGKSIPDNWAIDCSGKPTTDPNEALKGTLMPIGGPKGSGLALMIDIIAGILSGSNFGIGIKSFHSLDGATGAGFFCQAIDIGAFCDLDYFFESIENYCEYIKNSEKAEGISEIYLPGEIEKETENESTVNGIELDSSLINNLNSLLAETDTKYRLIEN